MKVSENKIKPAFIGGFVNLGQPQLDCNSHIRFRSMGPFRLRLEPLVLISLPHNQKLKRPLGRLNLWLGQLDSNQH